MIFGGTGLQFPIMFSCMCPHIKLWFYFLSFLSHTPPHPTHTLPCSLFVFLLQTLQGSVWVPLQSPSLPSGRGQPQPRSSTPFLPHQCSPRCWYARWSWGRGVLNAASSSTRPSRPRTCPPSPTSRHTSPTTCTSTSTCLCTMDPISVSLGLYEIIPLLVRLTPSGTPPTAATRMPLCFF